MAMKKQYYIPTTEIMNLRAENVCAFDIASGSDHKDLGGLAPQRREYHAPVF